MLIDSEQVWRDSRAERYLGRTKRHERCYCVACRHSKNEELDRSAAVVKRAHEKVLNFSLGARANRPSRASIGPGSEIEIKLVLRQKINPLCQHSRKARHKAKHHERPTNKKCFAAANNHSQDACRCTYLPTSNRMSTAPNQHERSTSTLRWTSLRSSNVGKRVGIYSLTSTTPKDISSIHLDSIVSSNTEAIPSKRLYALCCFVWHTKLDGSSIY